MVLELFGIGLVLLVDLLDLLELAHDKVALLDRSVRRLLPALNLGAQLCDLVFTLLESLALLLALLRQLSDLFLGCKSATIA